MQTSVDRYSCINRSENAEAFHAASLLNNTGCYSTSQKLGFIRHSPLPNSIDWLGGVGTAAIAVMMLATSSGYITGSQDASASKGEYIFPLIYASSQALDEPANFLVTGGDSEFDCLQSPRSTTEQEHTIAVLRSWEKYEQNWDYEGAKAPILSSLRAASRFVCLLDDSFVMPEPMLHDSGRAGLFWGEDQLYADLEFLVNGTVAYYIERGERQEKGVICFDHRVIPEIFKTLLSV